MSEARTIVKEVPNAVVYSDGTILLKNVRISYPAVFKMKEQTDPKTGKVSKAYSCTGLLPKKTHEAAKKLLQAEMTAILKANNKGEKLASDRKFLKDGDPKDEDDVGKPENAGMWIVSSREATKRPSTLSNKKDLKTGKAKRLDPEKPEDVEVIYGGCWGNMLIRLWWQNNAYGKRINAGIVAVQRVRTPPGCDDTPFGAGRISDDDLDETFETEEDEDAGGDDVDVDDL